ncbi:MAG: minichromosome maintenance protein MCM [Nanoarchaeota archaeon]|nr:minichromosome maintenance protein MCM [Nanoarchaeota archaeon]
MVDAHKQIEKFKEFFEMHYEKDLYEVVRKGFYSLYVDFTLLSQTHPDLADELLAEPEETIKAAELSLKNFDIAVDSGFDINKLRVRFFNLPLSQEIKIRNIRSCHLDKCIALKGIVRQTSDVRPQVVSATFECPSCGNSLKIPQLEQTFKEPSRCSCGRRGRFRLTHQELIDSQRLVLEESSDMLTGGEQPKRLSVFLREDLVEPKMERRTTPGSKVYVVGIVKEVPIPSKTGGMSTRFDLMCEANFIQGIEETYEDIEVNAEDEKKIRELARDPKVFEKLVASIAPSIYGHNEIKAALVLQLMGGVRKERPDGSAVKGDIHILLVGEPGTAKSSLLVYMSKAAPKARYVAGRSTSGAGISAVVVKDEFLRGWALEAGALVLANNGMLLIDEMDKMSDEDTSTLHEAMAQQQITIAKANIQATLQARTSILAAANPKFGRFDPYQPIAPQIAMPSPLINRFDLIFPVKDLPSKEKDTKIASHILEMHQNVAAAEPDIPFDLLKKYIAYVKQKVFPKLTQGAIEEMRNFYVSLRNTPTMGGDPGAMKAIPISARQLESLVRLAEASARVHLSNHVTRKDARFAIEALKSCLMQVGVDYETGQMDIDRITTGISASTRNKIGVVREILAGLEARGKKTIPLDEVLAESVERGLTESQVEEVITRLKQEGAIYEPKAGFIARLG